MSVSLNVGHLLQQDHSCLRREVDFTKDRGRERERGRGREREGGEEREREREREMVGSVSATVLILRGRPTSVDVAVHISEDVLQGQAFQHLQPHDVCGTGDRGTRSSVVTSPHQSTAKPLVLAAAALHSCGVTVPTKHSASNSGPDR